MSTALLERRTILDDLIWLMQQRNTELTVTDMFCGAGGSSTGALEVPGVVVKTAMNHSKTPGITRNLWDNRNGSAGAGNTIRTLTHESLLPIGGLAMNATRNTPETWKPVPGWEGFYDASTHGRIRSLARIVQRGGRPMRVAEKILKPYVGPAGYPRINLSREGVPAPQEAHKVIALAFHGPRTTGLEVRHMDGNQQNNAPANLRYGTSTENALDTVKHGNNVYKNRTHCPAGHELVAPNLVAAEQRKSGHRKCRACNSAHAMLYRRIDLRDQFQSVSDSYYSEYMAAA